MDKLLLLALAWMLYFAIHSLFASLLLKRWVAGHYPALMPYYRLTFNGLAVLLLVPPLWLIYYQPGTVIWQWSGIWFYLMNGLALVAVAGFYYSLRFYDSAEFLGFRQIRDHELRVEDQERLRISPIHCYVRHPWYFFALVLIWTRDMTPEWLLSAVLLSAYFILGSRLEDRKLVAYYGDAYRVYQKQVFGVWPLPWRKLDQDRAREIENMGNRSAQ